MIRERLQILLEVTGLTKRQFALKINLDPSYFYRIMQGKVIPSDRIIRVIASVFDVSFEWLKTGEGDMIPHESLSLPKRQVFELIETLEDEQVESIIKYIKCFFDK